MTKHAPKHHNTTPIVAIIAIVAVIGLVFLYSGIQQRVPAQAEAPAIDDASAAEPTGEAYRISAKYVPPTAGIAPSRMMQRGQQPVANVAGQRCLDDTDPENLPAVRGLVTLPPPQGLDLPEYLRDTCRSGTMLEQVDCINGQAQYAPADCSTMLCGSKPCNFCSQGICGYLG